MVEARIETSDNGVCSVACYIKCPICMDAIKAAKVSKNYASGPSGECFWCHSNFQKHVKRFHDDIVSYTRKKTIKLSAPIIHENTDSKGGLLQQITDPEICVLAKGSAEGDVVI